jgi:hypothetical protein
VDKKAAAEFLGVSTRTIESYASDGKISVTYSLGKNGRQAEYKEDELRALKEELATPVHRSVVAPGFAQRGEPAHASSLPNGSEIAPSGVFAGLATVPQAQQVVELLEEIAAQMWVLPWNRLVWNLEETAAHSGYSKFHLRSAIASGHLRARKVGRGWKIRPQDLREYTNWLFKDDEDTAQNRNRMAGIQN